MTFAINMKRSSHAAANDHADGPSAGCEINLANHYIIYCSVHFKPQLPLPLKV